MKKVIFALTAMSLSFAALATGSATGAAQKQETVVTTGSNAVSASNGGQQSQGISGSGNSSAGISGSGNSSAAAQGGAVSGNTLGGGSAAISGNTVQGGAAAVSGNTLQGGAVSGVNASNGLTVGCLVNCADNGESTRDAAAAQLQAAIINADAARDIAAINAEAQRAAAATKQKIYNTPSVNGPPLVSSNDTCMGSASGSVNVPGFGVGVGKTYTDSNCVMLKNSRELWNMGMKAAALALMCTDTANREALELTGFECPQTTKAKESNTKTSSLGQAEYTDPIVRNRLGLAPLVAAK